MKELGALLAATLVFPTLVLPSAAQKAVVNQTAPASCEKAERIKPNFELNHNVMLEGQVNDQTGAPFRNSVVELRRYENESKQTLVTQTTTDADGYFKLGYIHGGRYRLLASPTRAFKQAENLECGIGRDCHLPIVLEAERADSPLAQCPVR
jgi:protocatechuate 3,4-dioxygenase beta subunit